MVITKVEDVTRQGSCKILWRKLRLRGGLLLVLIQFLGGGVGVVAYLSLSGSGRKVGWGGRLFEAGRLLTFSAFRMSAYSRWALIRGWALIRINTVFRMLRNNAGVRRCPYFELGLPAVKPPGFKQLNWRIRENLSQVINNEIDISYLLYIIYLYINERGCDDSSRYMY